jgi:tetratricopeptide (TPR) repeat protein
VLSPAALASDWVQDDTRWAYNLQRKDPTRLILPVLCEAVELDEIWLFLQDFRRIEMPGSQPYPPEEAIRRTLRVLALTPAGEAPIAVTPQPAESLDDLLTQGRALQAQKKYAEALPFFQRTMQLYPNKLDAWIDYGLTLLELRRFEESLVAFDHALDLNPKSELAMRSKADTLFASGRYVEAVQAYDRALQDNPTYVTAWYNRGTALLALRRFEEAAENYRTLQRLDPRNSDAFMFQANALWHSGRRRDAIVAFEQALELKPGSLGDLTRPIRTLIRRYQ